MISVFVSHVFHLYSKSVSRYSLIKITDYFRQRKSVWLTQKFQLHLRRKVHFTRCSCAQGSLFFVIPSQIEFKKILYLGLFYMRKNSHFYFKKTQFFVNNRDSWLCTRHHIVTRMPCRFNQANPVLEVQHQEVTCSKMPCMISCSHRCLGI